MPWAGKPTNYAYNVMAIRRHNYSNVTRKLRGFCVYDHQLHLGQTVYWKKTSKIFKDNIQDSKTQKRQKET